MATKHGLADGDLEFLIDPSTRNIVKLYDGKAYLMQYDHQSESITFKVPRYIENHDMKECDVVQVHYENVSTGTNSSLRQSYRGAEVITDIKLEGDGDTPHDDDYIIFSWLVPSSATSYAGTLKFQLKFICHDADIPSIVTYRWHTNINSDISITPGLAYEEENMHPSSTATLKSLEIEETAEGVNIILDGIYHTVYHGEFHPDYLEHLELKQNKVTAIDEYSDDLQYPTAAAVRTLVEDTETDIEARTDEKLAAKQETLDEHWTAIQDLTTAIGTNATDIATNAEAIAANAAVLEEISPSAFERKLREISPFIALQPNENGQYPVEAGKTYRVYAQNNTAELHVRYIDNTTEKTARVGIIPSSTDYLPYVNVLIAELKTVDNGTTGPYVDKITIKYAVDGGEMITYTGEVSGGNLDLDSPTLFFSGDIEAVAEENYRPWLK